MKAHLTSDDLWFQELPDCRNQHIEKENADSQRRISQNQKDDSPGDQDRSGSQHRQDIYDSYAECQKGSHGDFK